MIIPAPVAAMDIKVVGDQVVMSGGIGGEELARLRDVLAERGEAQIKTVILRDSPGGDHWTSLRMGELIRDRGWHTAVSGYCSSGCAIMFMGGVERHFTDDKPVSETRVSFHGSYSVMGSARIFQDGKNPERTGESTRWIKARSGGKVSDAMLDRIGNLEKHGFVRFLDAARMPQADQPSVFLCVRPDMAQPRQCEPIIGTDAYQEGIATSRVLIRSNDRTEKETR